MMQSRTPCDANSPSPSLSREQNYHQLLSELAINYYSITINRYVITIHDFPITIRCRAERPAMRSPPPPPCIGSNITSIYYQKLLSIIIQSLPITIQSLSITNQSLSFTTHSLPVAAPLLSDAESHVPRYIPPLHIPAPRPT